MSSSSAPVAVLLNGRSNVPPPERALNGLKPLQLSPKSSVETSASSSNSTSAYSWTSSGSNSRVEPLATASTTHHLAPPSSGRTRRDAPRGDVMQDSPSFLSVPSSSSTQRPPVQRSGSPATGSSSSSHVTASNNASEQWESPEDEESAHVREVYAQFERTGVPNDGFDEGVELTRERNRSPAQTPAPQSTAVSARPGASAEAGGLAGTMGEGPSAEEARQRLEAEQKRDVLLAKLDRYGFFSQAYTKASSHGRTATLRASAYDDPPPDVPAKPRKPKQPRQSKASAKQRAVISPDLPVNAVEPNRSREEVVKERKRMDKWQKMMVVTARDEGGNAVGYRLQGSKAKKLEKRVYKGIPDAWRAQAWWAMIEERSRSRSASTTGHDGRGHAALTERQLALAYQDGLKRPSAHDMQIDLDVPRTISGHILFHTRYGRGQRSLFHVLHSFSLLCDTCGYCQGMGPIAATLICYFEPERAYAALTRLHDLYDLHSTFAPGFPSLVESFYIQERLVESLMPEVHEVFKEHMISTSAFATKWYITLFANTVPFKTQLRLWDAYFLEGPDLLIIIALAVVWGLRENFLDPSASFETMLSVLSSYMVVEDEDAFLSWVHKVFRRKDVQKGIRRWRAEWAELVERGEAMSRVT